MPKIARPQLNRFGVFLSVTKNWKGHMVESDNFFSSCICFFETATRRVFANVTLNFKAKVDDVIHLFNGVDQVHLGMENLFKRVNEVFSCRFH